MDILNEENIIKLHNGKTYTADDIEAVILAVAEDHFADGANIYTVNQSRWQAVLMQAGKILFENSALRDPSRINNKQYDKTLISKICDIYIYISKKYGKMITLNAFGAFCDIDYETLKDWRTGENLSREAIHTKSKIEDGQADAIINKLYDSNNVTGQAMLANNILGWNTSRSESKTTAKLENISTLADDFSALDISENKNILRIDENRDD